jgi:hypothetical protein
VHVEWLFFFDEAFAVDFRKLCWRIYIEGDGWIKMSECPLVLLKMKSKEAIVGDNQCLAIVKDRRIEQPLKE